LLQHRKVYCVYCCTATRLEKVEPVRQAVPYIIGLHCKHIELGHTTTLTFRHVCKRFSSRLDCNCSSCNRSLKLYLEKPERRFAKRRWRIQEVRKGKHWGNMARAERRRVTQVGMPLELKNFWKLHLSAFNKLSGRPKFWEKDDGLITKSRFFINKILSFIFRWLFTLPPKIRPLPGLLWMCHCKTLLEKILQVCWKSGSAGVVGKWFYKDIGFICYSSKYSRKHRNLLLLLCLYQTSCDMSTYFKLEDVRFCYFVFHWPQLHHVGNGTAWYTATQRGMILSFMTVMLTTIYMARQGQGQDFLLPNPGLTLLAKPRLATSCIKDNKTTIPVYVTFFHNKIHVTDTNYILQTPMTSVVFRHLRVNFQKSDRKYMW